MKALGAILLFTACASYGEGQAFYRILSSEPTRIVWSESMPNPDDPQEIWSSLVWSHDGTPAPEYAVSIAFDLHGTWSTQNIWQLDIEEYGFPTNFTPTTAAETFILQTIGHITDPDFQKAVFVSDIPAEYVRGQVIIEAEDGIGDSEVIALVDSYGHSIIERFPLSQVFLVAVPINEEITWATKYETNSIVRFGSVNSCGGSITILSKKVLQASDAGAPQPEH